jgi:hypothetical protein
MEKDKIINCERKGIETFTVGEGIDPLAVDGQG